MLFKLLFWFALLYFGLRWVMRKLTAMVSGDTQDSQGVQGKRDKSVPPYSPDDVVDVQYHDVTSTGGVTDEEKSEEI